MRELIKTAKNNAGKDFRQRRFSPSLQHFGMFLYMMCGKASYEIICNNIPLPQASTICNLIFIFVFIEKNSSFLILNYHYLVHYINKTKKRFVEGDLRCKELNDYLDKVDSPKAVWLSEDGSGIVSKVAYDSASNQLVGLVLPFHSETGIPIPFSFKPKSEHNIEKFLKCPTSTHLYLVMAQPIKSNTPPFILQIFGTDNKFTAMNIVQRWNHTKRELEK